MKTWILFFGPVLAVAVGLLMWQTGASAAISWTAGTTVLVAVWWIFEPIPISATSLIPIALFPLVGVLSSEDVAAAFGNKLVLLMLGGFLLSAGMERSGAHRRIALGMVNLFGGHSARRLVFGFMAASALLSMWISNAATVLMLLPIALAVVQQSTDRNFRTALLLGIAFAASIGGVGTPIGTPPNLVFLDVYERTTGNSLTFVEWMKIGVPVVILMLPLAGFWLTRNVSAIRQINLPDVGCWRAEEIRTLTLFAIVALLWITRQMPFGGWQQLAVWSGFQANANDASVALLGAVAMFILPNGKGEKLLDWESASRIPWGILVLFAGGICIATAFQTSGLSEQLAGQLSGLNKLPTWLMIGCICLAVTFLTEITSNTATTQLLLPILAAAAAANAVDPLLFMVPATISASFAFMLPVATPPNAIVFGSEQLSVGSMAREGFALNLLGVGVVTGFCYWLLA